ncbi:MAG: M16 family metallopeptidase [Pyrinomonadaceae bacterium]
MHRISIIPARLLCAAAVLLAVVPAAQPSARAQTNVPRLNYRERTLANGLKVYSVRDKSSPTVAIQVWYKVGSKDDPEGRSGFAHLFEHIMFKATKNMKAEMLDRLTEDVGGFNNASTWDDYTNYYEAVPSNYLETLLWAEADRLGALVVDDASFKSERDVVKEEFRQRYLSQPYGRLFYLIEQRSFTTHPYRRPGIGNIDELNAATIEDVKAFHATYYRPDNATLIVVGDFDQKQLDSWVDKYFARIPRPAGPLPRVTVKEPERRAEQRFTEYVPNVPLPAVAVTYLAPPVAAADADALRVAKAILADGDSSRIYQSLVYEQQVAQEAFANADLREDPGLFVLGAILASDKKIEDAEKSLLAELKKVQDKPVTAAELEKAKNQLVTNELRERETNNGKANALGLAAVLLGDVARANTAVERLQAVTAADVRRVMRKYFTDTNRVVIYYLPESMRPAKETTGKSSAVNAERTSDPQAAKEGGKR